MARGHRTIFGCLHKLRMITRWPLPCDHDPSRSRSVTGVLGNHSRSPHRGSDCGAGCSNTSLVRVRTRSSRTVQGGADACSRPPQGGALSTSVHDRPERLLASPLAAWDLSPHTRWQADPERRAARPEHRKRRGSPTLAFRYGDRSARPPALDRRCSTVRTWGRRCVSSFDVKRRLEQRVLSVEWLSREPVWTKLCTRVRRLMVPWISISCRMETFAAWWSPKVSRSLAAAKLRSIGERSQVAVFDIGIYSTASRSSSSLASVPAGFPRRRSILRRPSLDAHVVL